VIGNARRGFLFRPVSAWRRSVFLQLLFEKGFAISPPDPNGG
jgi:hypothetical protein